MDPITTLFQSTLAEEVVVVVVLGGELDVVDGESSIVAFSTPNAPLSNKFRLSFKYACRKYVPF